MHVDIYDDDIPAELRLTREETDWPALLEVAGIDVPIRPEPVLPSRGVLPTSVEVGSYTYAVEYSLVENYARAQKIFGRTNFERCHISIAAGQAPDCERDTMLHEVLHAIFYSTGLDEDCEDEEHIVRRLSPALVDVLRRNPLLVRYLCAD